MIRALLVITVSVITLFILAACKAAGEADREWEDNIKKDEEHTFRP